MTESVSLSAPMIGLLRDLREILNLKFRQKKGSGVKVDSEAWSTHIRTVIAPIVDSVHRIAEERTRVTLLELYDVSLDLFAAGHFSESGSSLLLFQLWKDVLPSLASTLSRSPRRIAGSLSNAVLALTMESPALAKRWLEELHKTSGGCENPQQLLDLGKLLAWTAGNATYRLPALVLTRSMPISLLRNVFQISDSIPETTIRKWLADMESDPWAQLSTRKLSGNYKTESVGVCGAFIGFGGLFLEPPKLFLNGGQIYVTENNITYKLLVDRFGNSFQRVGKIEPENSTATPSPRIDSKGTIIWEGCDDCQSGLIGPTSHAFDGRSLALTISHSFQIYLFAKQLS